MAQDGPRETTVAPGFDDLEIGVDLDVSRFRDGDVPSVRRGSVDAGVQYHVMACEVFTAGNRCGVEMDVEPTDGTDAEPMVADFVQADRGAKSCQVNLRVNASEPPVGRERT